MRPSKFVASQERRLQRALTEAECAAITAARTFSHGGKRETVKAMRRALTEAEQATKPEGFPVPRPPAGDE